MHNVYFDHYTVQQTAVAVADLDGGPCTQPADRAAGPRYHTSYTTLCPALQTLEVALADAHQTISRLHAAAASGEQESQATVSSLLSELAEKSSQLVDAERRFSELEAMMQRIASRTGQGPLLAEGQEDLGHEQQRLPLRNSWGLQQFQ